LVTVMRAMDSEAALRSALTGDFTTLTKPGATLAGVKELDSAVAAVGNTPIEEVLHLAEEQLNVGKRQIQSEKTRVRRFVVETPAERNVTLHEEQVEVVRRAISEPVNLKDVDWSEQILETTETAEQPVVSKNVRVSEEVVIRREGSDHVETIHETLRRQQLDVERVPESSATGAETVDTAVFCPPHVALGSAFLVQVFLYSPRAAKQVSMQARRADAAARRRGTYSLPLDLPLGTRVDLHLEFPGLSVPEPDAKLVWRGSPTGAQFEVGVPPNAAGAQVIGRVRIAVAGVPAGTLRFTVALNAAGTSPGAVSARKLRARRYRRAFVSYSSQDRAEVLRRVQAFQIAGLSVFQDILNLDAGERWQRALYHEIDNCDVFLLFWSHAAAASEWVRKEIEYALARKGGVEEQPPDIQPVPIEGPPVVPPPSSLSGLHFNDALLAQIQAAEPK
jgi:uncharacterized protein (TIGR02271 family)